MARWKGVSAFNEKIFLSLGCTARFQRATIEVVQNFSLEFLFSMRAAHVIEVFLYTVFGTAFDTFEGVVKGSGSEKTPIVQL